MKIKNVQNISTLPVSYIYKLGTDWLNLKLSYLQGVCYAIY